VVKEIGLGFIFDLAVTVTAKQLTFRYFSHRPFFAMAKSILDIK